MIFMVMLLIHAYINIMLMRIIISSCYYDSASFAFEFNRTLIKLEHLLPESLCHRIELFQCNHIRRYGTALTRSIVMPLAGASNEGRLWVRATLIR